MKAEPDTREMLTAGILAVVIIALACLFSGCDVNTKVRPFFWPKPPEPQPAVQPAPKPQPPPDDWAPPWFRRPKPDRKGLKQIDFSKFAEPNPKALNANPIPKVKR